MRSTYFSEWHHAYLPDDEPMIDVDGLPYCAACFAPLMAYESVDGNQPKPTPVLQRVAILLGVPAVLARTYGSPHRIHAVQRVPFTGRIGGAAELAAYESRIRSLHVCG